MEKESKKKIIKLSRKMCKLFILFMAVVMLFGNIQQTQNVCAAQKKTNSLNTSSASARKKFKEFLSKPSTAYNWSEFSTLSDLSFICFDVGKGKKKVPVMMATNSRATHADGYVALFQYCKGKVRKVCALDWVDAIYPKAGIFVLCHTGGGYMELNSYYYKIKSKNSLGKQVAYTAILDESSCTDVEYGAWLRKMFGNDQYQRNGKTITQTEFQKWWKKQVNESNKITNIEKKLKKNTASNRNRYFK